jgi:hypothetical protein
VVKGGEEGGGTKMKSAEDEKRRHKDSWEEDMAAKKGLIPTGDIYSHL